MEEVGRADLGTAGRLVLFAPCHDFHPGEVVQGVVQLSLNEPPFLLRGVRIKFTGVNRAVEWAEGGAAGSLPGLYSEGGRHGRGEVDLLENEEDYDGGGITEILVGLGEEVLENECDLLEFSEDNYSWDFSFTIPEDAPLSYCDDHLEILYSLSTVIDSPMVPSAACEILHNVVVGSRRPEPVQLMDELLGVGSGNSLTQSDRDGDGESNSLAVAIDQQNVEHADTREFSFASRIKAFLGYDITLLRRKNELHIELLDHPQRVLSFTDSRQDLLVNLEFPTPRAYKTIKVCLSVVVEVDTRPNIYVPFVDSTREKDGRKRREKNRSFARQQIVWKSEKTINLGDSESDSPFLARMKKEMFVVPTIIDSSTRSKTLRAWPRPEPLEHTLETDAHIVTPSISSPLGNVHHILQCEVLGLIEHSSFFGHKRRGKMHRQTKVLMANETELLVKPAERLARNHEYLFACRVNGPTNSLHCDGQLTRKYSTPHAKEAPIRVVGELMHRGSAAVLVDRGGRVRPSCTTPECFAPLTHISNHQIAYNHSTPSFSPALAYIHHNDSQFRGGNAGNGDLTPAPLAHIGDGTSSTVDDLFNPDLRTTSVRTGVTEDVAGNGDATLDEPAALERAHVETTAGHDARVISPYPQTPSRDSGSDGSPATTVEPLESPDSAVSTESEDDEQALANESIKPVSYVEMTGMFRRSTRLLEWLETKFRLEQLPTLHSSHQCVELLSIIEVSAERENILLWMVRKHLLHNMENELFGSTGIIGKSFQLQHDIDRVSSHARNEILVRQN